MWLCVVFHKTQALARPGLWRHARPPRGGPEPLWGRKIHPMGKTASGASDSLLCLERERPDIWIRGINEWWGTAGQERAGGDQRVDEMQIWNRTCAQVPGTVQNMRALRLGEQCTGQLHPGASLPRPRAAPRGSCTEGGGGSAPLTDVIWVLSA